MKEPKKVRRILYFLIFTAIISLIIFISRGPYISNGLKRIILPELEDALGQKVMVQKIYINVFPLFIEARDMKIFDEDGNRIVFAKRVKGYIGLSKLLSRQLSIQRLVIKEPDISTNRDQLNEIIKSVKTYLEKERKTAFKVKIKVIEVINGNAYLRDDNLKGEMGIRGLGGELIIGKNPRLKTTIKELTIEEEGWPDIKCDVNASVVLNDDRVEINHLEVGSYGSRFKGEGFYSKDKGALKTEIALIVDSVKRIFNLKQRGDGKIFAKGEVRLDKISNFKFQISNFKDLFVDLKVSGNFYIETLMELLKVEEKVEGLVDFHGKINGHLSDISGRARARLRNGNLFGVDIDSLSCNVLYNNRIMRVEKGDALLYNGTAKADASFNLPGAESFTLNVKFSSIDSSAALKLIGWEPEIPAGKVDGELATSGSTFNPDGWFVYKAHKPSTENVLGRIKDIKGTYSVRNDILTFSNLQLNTSLSNLTVNGTVDIANRTLNLKNRLRTDDISDFTLPYYRGAKGHGVFSGGITGSFDNPKISGRAGISNVLLEGYRVENVTSDFSYDKNLLNIHESVFRSPDEEHNIKGKIFFPEAKGLFDLSMPVYNLRASLKNAEFGKVIQIFYKDFLAKGRLNADLKIGGKDKDVDISGNTSVEKASAYNIPFDSASMAFSYTNKELSLKNIFVMKGKSTLTAEGKLLPDKRFSYRASSKKFLIKDIGLDRMPDDAVLSLQSEGHGTFENPTIILSAKVAGGTFKGRNMGSGTINATIKNRDISLNAALFNEKMKLSGNGHLDDKLPWSAELYIHPGRYDFIVSSILKDVPEDLQFDLEGRVDMKGDRKNITASVNINHLTLSLFGQTFLNDSDIHLLVNNRNFSFTAFTIKSDSTSFRVKGGLEIGKEYNISLDGSSSLAPFKGLSKKIGYLKGDTDFVITISGKWEKPNINGGVKIANVSFGLRDYPTYISSIDGYLTIDEDRIILKNLSGKIGGGNVNISGLVYLQAFRIKRFHLEANLDNITTSLTRDFNINFNGSLLYKGTSDVQSITGDIKINRALYKEMVEWRTWLLSAKAKEKPKAELSVFEMAELNIRISGSDNISVDNNIARASIRGDMILKGSPSSPALLGRLESTEGYVYFRNNEFRIIFASADFTDPNRIKPVINLSADTVVNGYTIRLNLEGQLDHFNLSLSSDPHLEEVDILALLTVGQVGKQLKGIEGGIGAGEATSFLTGRVQDVLEERMRTLTGLDRFQVEPYVSKITGTVGPRVTVSKRLIGDRLFVTYTALVGSTEEQILKLEYLLDKNTSLIGFRDEKASIGGDIKFRFEFK
ncbi:MAG: translocation/assembly module TamB domain-containing protein [Nitrospirota bacterium]